MTQPEFLCLTDERVPNLNLSLMSFSLKDEKQRFTSVLLVARLLAKFLGFLTFMPYRTSEAPPREIQEAAIALRSKVHALAKHDREISSLHELFRELIKMHRFSVLFFSPPVYV